MRIPRRSASVAAAIAVVGLIAAGCSDADNAANDAAESAVSGANSAVESVAGEARSAVESMTGEEESPEGTDMPAESVPAFDETSAVPGPNGGTVDISGPILAKYDEIGGAESALGTATGNQEDVDDGAVAEFDGGVIAWSPDTDAHIVWGEIRTAWESEGGAGGEIGFPVSDEEQAPGGYRSNFEYGYITYIDGETNIVRE